MCRVPHRRQILREDQARGAHERLRDVQAEALYRQLLETGRLLAILIPTVGTQGAWQSSMCRPPLLVHFCPGVRFGGGGGLAGRPLYR